MLRFWDGSGIGQTMCKQCQSAPCCKQITTPPADCSVMCWMLFLNPTSSVKALKKPEIVGEFGSCQGNIGELTSNLEKRNIRKNLVRETLLFTSSFWPHLF